WLLADSRHELERTTTRTTTHASKPAEPSHVSTHATETASHAFHLASGFGLFGEVLVANFVLGQCAEVAGGGRTGWFESLHRDDNSVVAHGEGELRLIFQLLQHRGHRTALSRDVKFLGFDRKSLRLQCGCREHKGHAGLVCQDFTKFTQTSFGQR